MITPFDTKYGQAAVAELTENSAFMDAVNNIRIYVEPPSDDELAFQQDDVVDTEYGSELWTAVCLLDDAVNSTGYARQCIGYAEQYSALLESLKTELSKKKFLTRKPVHDLPALLRDAADALDEINGKNCPSELLDEMKAQEREQEFLNSVLDLQNRLRSQIEI